MSGMAAANSAHETALILPDAVGTAVYKRLHNLDEPNRPERALPSASMDAE